MRIHFPLSIVLATHLLGAAAAGAESWHFESSVYRTEKANGKALEARPSKQNYAYAPDAGKDKHQLVLFMPGTGVDVDPNQRYMAEAAKQGYWVVGVDYINDHSGWQLCTCNRDCNGDALAESIVGTVPAHTFYDNYLGGDATKIAYNSVQRRLHDWLEFLTKKTGKDFMQFWAAKGDHPEWSKIIAAGHSQGGAMAIWLAGHRQELVKAIALSAPIPYLNIPNSCQVNAGNHSACPIGGAPADPTASNAPAPQAPGFKDQCTAAKASATAFLDNPKWKWQAKLRIFASFNDPGYSGSPNPGKNILANAGNLGLTPVSVTSKTNLGTSSHPFLVMPDGEYKKNTSGAACDDAHTSTVFACGPTWLESVWDNQLAH